MGNFLFFSFSFFLFWIIILASTTKWFSRRKRTRTIECFRSGRSKSMCIGTFNEPIRADRSNYWVTIKPSAIETTGYRIWTSIRSTTSKNGDWWNASCEYGKKLYVQFVFFFIDFRWYVNVINEPIKIYDYQFRSSFSRFSIHFVLLDKYSANRSGKLLQRYSRLISLEIRT